MSKEFCFFPTQRAQFIRGRTENAIEDGSDSHALFDWPGAVICYLPAIGDISASLVQTP